MSSCQFYKLPLDVRESSQFAQPEAAFTVVLAFVSGGGLMGSIHVGVFIFVTDALVFYYYKYHKNICGYIKHIKK